MCLFWLLWFVKIYIPRSSVVTASVVKHHVSIVSPAVRYCRLATVSRLCHIVCDTVWRVCVWHWHRWGRMSAASRCLWSSIMCQQCRQLSMSLFSRYNFWPVSHGLCRSVPSRSEECCLFIVSDFTGSFVECCVLLPVLRDFCRLLQQTFTSALSHLYAWRC